MNVLNTSMVESKPAVSSGIRGWLSTRTPGFFGVEYSQCTPVLARGSALTEDLAGRAIEWAKPPKDVVFYNLVPDPKIVGERSSFELDYILGESDAATNLEARLGNGTLVYWAPVAPDAEFKFDDALILSYADTHKHADLEEENVNPDWLCLRRVGHEDGRIFSESGQLLVRSLNVPTGEVLHDEVAVGLVKGRVFGKYSLPTNGNRVRMAASLPFAPDEP